MEIYTKTFSRFLDWIQYQEYYVTDYVFDDITAGKKHMVVVKIPEEYRQAYVHFLNGSYSKMYTDYELTRFFMKDKYDALSVLKKKTEYLEEVFVNEVNERFNTEVSSHEIEGTELDFKPNYREEIFNF